MSTFHWGAKAVAQRLKPGEKWTYWDLLLTYTDLVFVHFYILGNFTSNPVYSHKLQELIICAI